MNNNHWETKRLGQVADIYQPKTITSKQIKKHGPYKVYGANGSIGYYDQYNHERSEVLITCRGATCGNINYSEPKSWITGNSMVVHPTNPEVLDKGYLFHSLNAIPINTTISGSAQPQITRSSLQLLNIPLPRLDIQTKIAFVFSTLDETIEKTDQIIQKTELLKKGLIQDLLTKRSKKDIHDWKKIKLGDVVNIRNGYAYKGGNFRDYETTMVLLTPGNVSIGGGFNFDKFKYYEGEVERDFVLHKGDIFIALTDLTPQANFLGYPARVPDIPSKIFLHNQRLGLVQSISKRVDLNFLYYILHSDTYRKYVVSGATGTTVRHTSTKKLLDYEFELPSFLEQQKIANILSTTDEKIITNKKIKEKLLILKKGLMQDIFSQKVQIN